MIEFKAWPKIPRWNRDIIITEKIDGTNGAIIIEQFPFGTHVDGAPADAMIVLGPNDDELDGLPKHEFLVAAQSRKRVITPKDDNHGFARWVYDNAEQLARVLGEGVHFGEWWGSGINRGYGCNNGEKYFSLFNVKRWDDKYDPETWPPELSIVPVLYQGPLNWTAITMAKGNLLHHGSMARSPFMQPEGIVIYHTAANEMFKITLVNDEAPKCAA